MLPASFCTCRWVYHGHFFIRHPSFLSLGHSRLYRILLTRRIHAPGFANTTWYGSDYRDYRSQLAAGVQQRLVISGPHMARSSTVYPSSLVKCTWFVYWKTGGPSE
ncbi:hypothetical protein VTK56DRAFT_8060 [Thermocarpiscus australiensis]